MLPPDHPQAADHRQAVLITGASSGIGRALALSYAARGALLHLGGRDEARLEETAALCAARGATAHTRCVDVLDAEGMSEWIAAADRVGCLDVVIASAWIYVPGEESGTATPAELRTMFEVNVLGVMNTVLPILPAMRSRHRGRIVLLSSLASFRNSSSPVYGASKAAVRIWGESLRAGLRREGVVVTVVCPGHVRTPICDAADAMDVGEAASRIMAGAAADRPLVAFPWDAYLRAWLPTALPPGTREWITRLKSGRGGGRGAPSPTDRRGDSSTTANPGAAQRQERAFTGEE